MNNTFWQLETSKLLLIEWIVMFYVQNISFVIFDWFVKYWQRQILSFSDHGP